jgi:hypothetical protein
VADDVHGERHVRLKGVARFSELVGLERSKAKLGLRMSAMRSVKSELSLQYLQKQKRELRNMWNEKGLWEGDLDVESVKLEVREVMRGLGGACLYDLESWMCYRAPERRWRGSLREHDVVDGRF